MVTAGIDLGSVATKVILLKDDDVAARAVLPTGPRPRISAESALAQAVQQAGVDRSSVRSFASTGYSRRQVGFAARVVTEIAACARGACHLPGQRKPGLVIDLGGQDTKAILLDPDGGVEDFVMNDKCAAGTGRFLELIAQALGLNWDQLAELDVKADTPVKISSTCTVFAESEVISLVSHGETVENIVAGVHRSIADRITAMLGRLPLREPVLFCGGGATDEGVRRALQQRLRVPVLVPEHPQFVNALGAALIAAGG